MCKGGLVLLLTCHAYYAEVDLSEHLTESGRPGFFEREIILIEAFRDTETYKE